MTGHVQRCPAIEHTGIASTVCGPESFTPDHKPLVGPQPGVRGLWQASGGTRESLARERHTRDESEMKDER